MEDELYLENIDEFVTDQNRIVSPAAGAVREEGWGGGEVQETAAIARPPQEGATPPLSTSPQRGSHCGAWGSARMFRRLPQAGGRAGNGEGAGGAP